MHDDDPFLDAAFLYIAVICDGCSTIRDEDTPTSLEPKYLRGGWDNALADALRLEGWWIEYDNSEDGLAVFCPTCAARDS